ncbi:hypothetical protein BY996DRAFT_6621312 [Phakopsora pachyrhizi]|nr:hypothetical protein BY996DRAFT_6621312 [Phakopsora pachyrhizi]
MVEEVIQEFKPIIFKDYARPKTCEATAWPVMWRGMEGKSINQICTMFEHYIKEFNIKNLKQPNPEQFNKRLESEKKIAKKTDNISVHPDPTTPKAETPTQNFCRTVSMNILQQGQSARLNQIQAMPKAAPQFITVGPDTRLDNRVLDLKTPVNQAIFKVKSRICNLYRSYLDKQGFIEIHTPKIQGAATESGTSVFKLQYFDQTAFLAQLQQLAKQMAIGADFERVYEIGPVFRAENSNTYQHMS